MVSLPSPVCAGHGIQGSIVKNTPSKPIDVCVRTMCHDHSFHRTFSTTADEVDIIFMLDSTNKPGKNFPAIQSYVKSVLNSFSYGDTSTRVGLISFDNFAYSRAYLNSEATRDDLYQAVDDIPVQKGSSNFYTALWLLYSGTFMQKRGDRSSVPNVAVMITDNAPSNNVRSKLSGPMLTVAKSIRELGTQLIAVTIGDSVPKRLIEDIVGSPSLILGLDNYDALKQTDVVQHLVFRIKERSKTYCNCFFCPRALHLFFSSLVV